jgi:uncharacterized protein DUF6879
VAALVRDGLTAARHSAVHLEMRDDYTAADPVFARWKAGEPIDASEQFRSWFDLIVATVARGVQVRRARIVSEPVTDYIRYEHELTAALNVAAGEQVSWLPRRRASDLAVPGNDFWLFDDKRVVFNHFAGNGGWTDPPEEACTDPAVAKLCASAFEAVWARAIPNEDYRPV